MEELNKYPHVVDVVLAVWGNDEAMQEYIDKIAMSDRLKREGFSKEAWTYLLFIKDLHSKLYGGKNL